MQYVDLLWEWCEDAPGNRTWTIALRRANAVWSFTLPGPPVFIHTAAAVTLREWLDTPVSPPSVLVYAPDHEDPVSMVDADKQRTKLMESLMLSEGWTLSQVQFLNVLAKKIRVMVATAFNAKECVSVDAQTVMCRLLPNALATDTLGMCACTFKLPCTTPFEPVEKPPLYGNKLIGHKGPKSYDTGLLLPGVMKPPNIQISAPNTDEPGKVYTGVHMSDGSPVPGEDADAPTEADFNALDASLVTVESEIRKKPNQTEITLRLALLINGEPAVKHGPINITTWVKATAKSRSEDLLAHIILFFQKAAVALVTHATDDEIEDLFASAYTDTCEQFVTVLDVKMMIPPGGFAHYTMSGPLAAALAKAKLPSAPPFSGAYAKDPNKPQFPNTTVGDIMSAAHQAELNDANYGPGSLSKLMAAWAEDLHKAPKHPPGTPYLSSMDLPGTPLAEGESVPMSVHISMATAKMLKEMGVPLNMMGADDAAALADLANADKGTIAPKHALADFLGDYEIGSFACPIGLPSVLVRASGGSFEIRLSPAPGSKGPHSVDKLPMANFLSHKAGQSMLNAVNLLLAIGKMASTLDAPVNATCKWIATLWTVLEHGLKHIGAAVDFKTAFDIGAIKFDPKSTSVVRFDYVFTLLLGADVALDLKCIVPQNEDMTFVVKWGSKTPLKGPAPMTTTASAQSDKASVVAGLLNLPFKIGAKKAAPKPDEAPSKFSVRLTEKEALVWKEQTEAKAPGYQRLRSLIDPVSGQLKLYRCWPIALKPKSAYDPNIDEWLCEVYLHAEESQHPRGKAGLTGE